MRNDQVENGVNFLVHPKVKAAPLSQRISFLENKGLTSEEISAALARVETQDGSDGKLGAGTSFESTTSGPSQAKSLPTEPDVPLWRKISVPGAVVLGAVGAVGVYHAASRSTLFNGYSSSSDNQTAQQQQASAPNGNGYVSGNGAANGTRYNSGQGARQVDENIHGEHNYTRESPVDHSADGNACFASTVDDRSGIGIATSLSRITSSGDLEDAVVSEALGGISASDLAGEFRRLSQAMEQQTGQLVEAVGAMKSLASRAEQDSSSLLAARVNNHTSELRAELGTIKQLLLLQSGPGGGVAMEAAEVAKEGKGSIEVTGGGAGPGEGVRPGGGSADTIEIITNGAAGTATAGRNGSVHFGNSPSSVGNVGGKLSMTSATCGTVSPEVKGPKQDESVSQTAAQTAVVARRKEAARTSLSALLANNSPQAAKDGIAMLRMLVANLIKQPNVPRYRRIATTNDNFKMRVLPLEGHQAMMEAVGFKAKGSTWEWTWHEDSAPGASANNKAVLEDIVTAIDAAARPNGRPPTASPAPATWQTQPGSPPAAASTVIPNATRSITPIPSFHGRNTDFARFETNKDFRKAAPTDAGSVVSGGGERSQHLRAVQGGINEKASGLVETGKSVLSGTSGTDSRSRGAQSTVGSKDGSTSSLLESIREKPEAAKMELTAGGDVDTVDNGKNEPSIDVSLAEVAAAIERGEEPPGIRRIEDRLSVDAKLLTSSSASKPCPLKPWEVKPTVRKALPAGHDPADGGVDSGVEGCVAGDGNEEVSRTSPPSSLAPQLPQQEVPLGP